MSRLNVPQRNEGHRFDSIQNNDLDQKLTYQQLLNLNHDLSKDNMILQNTSISICYFSSKTWAVAQKPSQPILNQTSRGEC